MPSPFFFFFLEVLSSELWLESPPFDAELADCPVLFAVALELELDESFGFAASFTCGKASAGFDSSVLAWDAPAAGCAVPDACAGAGATGWVAGWVPAGAAAPVSLLGFNS